MFPRLFSTLKLGHVTVNNRICTSAHAECLAEDGLPTEKTIRYYEAKAKGGVGLILCFGSASVHPTSTARDWNGVELFEGRVVPHLGGLARPERTGCRVQSRSESGPRFVSSRAPMPTAPASRSALATAA